MNIEELKHMDNTKIIYTNKGKINVFFQVWDYKNKKVHSLQVNRKTKDVKYIWSVNIIRKKIMGNFINISIKEKKEICNYLKNNLDNYKDKF